MKLVLATTTLATSLFVGCASSPGTLSAPANDFACIGGGTANFLRIFTQGEPHVAVIPEGRSSLGAYSRHCLPAGRNTILIRTAFGPILADERVNVTLDGGRQYQVRAKLNSGKFAVEIVDITFLPERLTYSFNIEYWSLPGEAKDVARTNQ